MTDPLYEYDKKIFKAQTWKDLNKTIAKLAPYPKLFFQFKEFDIFHGVVESTFVENDELHLLVYGVSETRKTYRQLVNVTVSYERAVTIFSKLRAHLSLIERIIHAYEEEKRKNNVSL